MSRYDDCKEVLRNSDVFARDPERAGFEKPESTHSIQKEDPPVQQYLRRRMLKTLHSQDLRGIAEDGVSTLVKQVESIPIGQEIDLLSHALAPACMRMISMTLGVKPVDSREYHSISRALTRGMDSGFDPSRLPAAQSAGEKLRSIADGWFEEDLKAGFIQSLQGDPEVQNELASRGKAYLRNTVAGIFNAGYSTSFAMAASILHTLNSAPEVIDLARSADDANRAADELVRYLSPAQATSRYCVKDWYFGDQFVAAGSSVITLMGSANRDPRKFENADIYCPDRPDNQHLGFAWGPHVCLGARLASEWTQALLRRLPEWSSSYEVNRFDRADSATLRTYDSIMVRRGEVK
ncbi:cytochrome P450 [Micrococcus yunnanensis]|uniref:Cytochrome P450 n=1 Tax=Micrococcus yunnanensis TaxID=566027 RepID=A0ABR6D3K3_9MICC|nr:cytochrome P450 [Micrococcus yunnanensis]MBA9060632.1 cytochrome P450 [Micrococcus yunnanensis]